MLEKYAAEIDSYVSSIVKEREDAVMPSRDQFIRLHTSPALTRKVPCIQKIND